jgi:choice-of-anchor B domain-containing protein
VELQLIPTQSSEWHEIKTWDHYAYVSNETGGGILIVDLTNLPGIVTYSYFTDPLHANLNTVHSIWIDEQGFLYTFGSNFGEDNHGGAEMYDLNADPLNPEFVSFYAPTEDYTTDYIHDGFVRGDTLWASHIYVGLLEIVDISDKLNPVSLASFSTPNYFTHNAWPTHDNHYVFTTDEVDNSYLASYDVSDLSNITMLDKVQSHPGSNAIVHNVHLYNDSFAVTSYYTEGVVIFDVTHPDNMIKIGQYDESSLSGGGYGGDWGVYPYLPSGNLLVSDMEEGLFVLTPTYAHAAWLFGHG